jgi:hypothetical protein
VKYEIRALDTQMQTVVQAQPIDNPSSGPTRHKFLEAILKFVYLPEEEKRTVRKEFGARYSLFFFFRRVLGAID